MKSVSYLIDKLEFDGGIFYEALENLDIVFKNLFSLPFAASINCAVTFSFLNAFVIPTISSIRDFTSEVPPLFNLILASAPVDYVTRAAKIPRSFDLRHTLFILSKSLLFIALSKTSTIFALSFSARLIKVEPSAFVVL